MAFLDETGLAHFWNQILARLNKFVPAETGKGLSSNDYTTEEKEKLAGVESGANKTTVDSSLSSTSINPVQNKIINTKLTTMQSDINSKADGDHTHSELVNGNASVVLNVDPRAYGLSPQYITTFLPESTNVYSYLGTSSNKWGYVYANNINLNGTDLQSTLDSKVPSTRTVNGKALSANITLSASDVGALPNTTQIPSIDGLATETYVDNKVAGLVDSAPATLDTLNELAAALGDDPSFATTVATQIGTKVDKVDGKGLSTNDYTTAEKTKLSGIAAGAEVNQNAFSNVTIGSTTISADSKTDTLTLVAGNNVTITPDASNDKITIAATDTTYGAAETSLGLVQSGGDVTIKSGVITVNDDSHNHIIANVDGLQASIDSKVDKVTGKGLSTNDLTNVLKANYDTAYTHSQQAHAPANAEKNVIVGVQKNGADLTVNSSTRKVNITVPTKTSELTNDSSFVTTTDLDGKVDKVSGKGLSTNDYTTEEKTKLASIEEGANKTVVDTALNATSTNPVQNKVINTKLTTMQSDIDSKVPSARTVNGKALTANITLSASDVGARPNTWTPSASDVGALPISGGTLTGNLTGKYITGTWLQSTADNHLGSKPPKVCVQDASGWMYHRTAEELRDDIGAAPAPFKPEGKSYLTFSSPSSFTLKVYNSTKHWDGTLEYFASDKTWTIWDGTTSLTAIDNDGEHVLYLRGAGNTVITGNDSSYRWVFTGSNITCIGNIETLLDYATVASEEHPRMLNYCYRYMFYDCTALTQAPVLPATTLADYCYSNMFQSCTSLTQAPALPAITLTTGCYQQMFYGCTALTQASALPATTLADYCYSNMFVRCASLTQAPALPATTLADRCYISMFDHCTSLTQAPALPAITLTTGCYQKMFYGCTALTQAPALPATTLADYCYKDMFRNCTSLTQAPALPSMTLATYCYGGMFFGCTSLTQAPALPSMTLAAYCYDGMFYDCTALTQAPALPATTLADYCYNGMFHDCTSLKFSSTQTGEYTQEYRIPMTGTGTTANGALASMFASTGGTFTGTPGINTTYYLSSDNMVVRETEIATLNGYVGSMIKSAYTYGTEDLVAGASELATGTLYFVYE